MDFSHQANSSSERRTTARVDAVLRFNYQVISETKAKLDPYHHNFMLPRYFQLLSEFKQIDEVLGWELERVKKEQPDFGHILGLLNQKLDLINSSNYESIQSYLPSPQQVNVSESGLSFFTDNQLRTGSYIHLTLSDPEGSFHVAATAHIVYCLEQPDGSHRVGAHFISIHQKDRTSLSDAVNNNLISE